MAFNDVIKIINAINESILESMTNNSEKNESHDEFYNHLKTTINWYTKISYINKKLYALALVEDVNSAWTLSLLLKSIWNCRPKDSVFSVSGPVVLSAYDQTPFDNNRTAIPVAVLAQVMNDDRQWFLSLEPESQAIVLLELLAVAGGPVLWQVLRRAQNIYERYREYEMENLKESVIVAENLENMKSTQPAVDITYGKKDLLKSKPNDSGILKQTLHMNQVQKQLEESLAVWNSSVKMIRDSFQLEEMEVTFKDGSNKKIWKVDRLMPEITETVDFLQLLPSAIALRVLGYLPYAQLNEYARVNKYWNYLIEEYKAELLARQKINVELEKLRDVMLRNNNSSDTLVHSSFRADFFVTQRPSQPSIKTAHGLPSIRASQKSGPYSFRHLKGKVKKGTRYTASKPICNMKDMYERLEQRGAADENIWKWCKNVLKQNENNNSGLDYEEVIKSTQNNELFPHNLMLPSLKIPLSKPLIRDPAAVKIHKKSKTPIIMLLKNRTEQGGERNAKRFNLWSRDFSSLYPVSKFASHQLTF